MKNASKNPLKKKLAARFLNALNSLTKSISPSPPPSTAEKARRHRAVRAAAYASMASAVGPRKAWSRALLKKIWHHKLMMIHGKGRMAPRRRRRRRRRNPSNSSGTRFGHEGLNDLSEVVPGGKAMDSCRLLIETGHYIKCLRAQVEIMRQVLEYSSSRIL